MIAIPECVYPKWGENPSLNKYKKKIKFCLALSPFVACSGKLNILSVLSSGSFLWWVSFNSIPVCSESSFLLEIIGEERKHCELNEC